MDKKAAHAKELIAEVLEEIEKGKIAGCGIEADIIKADGIIQYGNKLVYSFIIDTSDVEQKKE